MKTKLLKNPILLIMIYILSLSVNSVFAVVNSVTVSVTPDTTNYYGGYDIRFVTGGSGNNELNPPDDSLIVLFDTTTVLPSSISSDDITVNSIPVNGSVVISGQRVSFPVPDFIPRHGESIRIIFSANASIRNPATSGTHQLGVATTAETQLVYQNYTIYQSISTVTAAGVMPNPSLAGESAAYTVGFDVGGGGYLPANEGTITIAFDTSLTIPTGALSGVTVNGTAATAIANNDTVVLTSPVEIDNSASVSVYFASGAGLVNPVDAGNYVLSVKTSSEPTFMESDSFGISPSGQLSISAISTKPDTVNQTGEFSFDVRTGGAGALVANVDSFFVIFPQNTFFPATISPSHVTISSGGIGTDAYAVSVLKSDQSDEDTVFVVTPINVGNSSDITMIFTGSAGYSNPSISGNYTLKLASSAERVPVSSNPYAVYPTSSRVDQALVIPTDNSVGPTSTDYTVNFNLGTLGRLKSGTSTITVTFPALFGLSETLSDYSTSTITVNGGTPVSLTSYLQVSNTNKTIEVTIPAGLETANSNNIVLFFGGNTPITNPVTIDNYQLDIRTSVETSDVKSSNFGIGGGIIDITNVALSDQTVNNNASYTFSITIYDRLFSGDNIKIIFPAGTVLPGSIIPTSMWINTQRPSSISVNQSTRTVTAYLSATVGRNNRSSSFDVVIETSAGVYNPVVPSTSFYKVSMNTSRQIMLRTSNAYPIYGDATQVTNVNVNASPSVVDAVNVPYTVNFTTSATGKLRGGAAAGSSTIRVEFGDGTIVPATISPSNIEVNSTPVATASVVQSGQAGTIALTMPNGLTINNSTAASILFKNALGLNNGSSAGTYNLRVRTSSDTVYSDSTGASGDYALALSQPLYITSITPTPATQNASASYSVKFTNGSLGALSAGDSIRIVFPQNTYLPPTISTSNVTVNGANPSVNPTVQGDTLTITAPDTVNSLTPVTILINQVAGLLNPTLAKGYTLKVITSAEAGPFTSPNYNITATASTVSAATVTPMPYRPSTPTAVTAKYTVNFNVGNNGRLMAGTSTITVTLNSSTTVSAVATEYDSTYIIVDGVGTRILPANINISGRAITMTVPASVSIHNNDAASIILNRTGASKPITNPVSTGSYTLQVRTSVETTNITSNSYQITTADAVTGIRLALSDNIVNAESADTVSFTAQNQITSPTGKITITFPSNTFIPVSIAASRVSVAHHATNPTSFTNATAVVTNPATRTVVVTVPQTILANDSVRVAIAAAAGVQNPSITGSNYTLQVKTTSQNINGTSAPYTLAPTTTTILNLGVVIDPITPSVNGEYTFTFQTGSRGRLVSGTSMIYLLLPDDATFTQSVPAVSKVTVNGTQADAVDLLPRTGTNPDTLIVTVPTTVTIGNMTNVTVLIDVTAGLRNASSTGLLRYQAYTSVETGSVWLDASLPVELTLFVAESRSGVVYLNWETESEVENAYWMIQRRKLAEEEALSWKSGKSMADETESVFETINTVDGKGSISEKTVYAFADSVVEVGAVYAYRLADVSYNGTVTFHKVVYQEVKAPLEFKLYKNFPNPFNPSTNIRYSLPMDSRVELKVFNILGQIVTTLNDDMVAAGIHTVQWNGKNKIGLQVASGTYFVYFSAKSADSNRQFTKVMKILLIR